MKAEFQVKFLQYLNQKKRRDKGFTLIELLVVIIIIGILAAIALPTFLKQTANAKQATAKSVIGFVNTAQTVYRTENNQFTQFSNLALGLSSTTNYYTYSVSGLGDTATVTAQTGDSSLKGYSGGNVRFIFVASQSESAIASVICEVNSPGTSIPTIPSPLNSNQSNANVAIGCNGGGETQL